MAKGVRYPKCGSTEVARHRQGTTLYGTPNIYLTCLVCGRQWRPGKSPSTAGGCGCLLLAVLVGSCILLPTAFRPQTKPAPATGGAASQPAPPPEQPSQEGGSEPLGPKPIAAIFANPQAIAMALASEGYVPDGWKKPDPRMPHWTFMIKQTITEGNYTHVGDVPNDITFSGESSRAGCVETITLTANVFNVREEERVVKQYVELVPRLFQVLGLDLPKGLDAAVAGKQPYSQAMEYGDVVFSVEEYKMGYGLKLIIQPAFEGQPRRSLPVAPATEPLDGKDQSRQLPDEKITSTLGATERPFRTWTDSSGKFTVEAQFMGAAFGNVKLRRRDGTTITVPLDKLSEADQEWIKGRR